MGGETYYPVEYGNHFYRIFFAYVLAETHNKVATIIFYFARAVSHATVERDRVPRAPEKEDLTARELLRRADSAGPVSPICFDV
jgi:hypothetical protein